MAEPENLIVPLLREMRLEMKREFADVKGRLDHLESRFDNLKQAVNGESVLGRYAAAEVEQRLGSIEERLAALETSK
jgi:tetrahydromethanopterin S-methyltransferase subunit G